MTGSIIVNRSSVKDQTKQSPGSVTPNGWLKTLVPFFPCPNASHRGLFLEPGLEVGCAGECWMAMEPARAEPETATWVPLPMSSPKVGGARGVGCPMRGPVKKICWPWRSDPEQHKLARGTWNGTSLVGKELQLTCEGEKFQLDSLVLLRNRLGLDFLL